MTTPRHDRMLARLAAYAAARQAGDAPEAAIGKAGDGGTGTMYRYERWYRETILRLPRRTRSEAWRQQRAAGGWERPR